MTKKKVVVFVLGIFILTIVVLAVFWFAVYNKDITAQEYKEQREGMKVWATTDVPGISLYVPDYYEETRNDYYTLYTYNGARVTLTSDEVSNDLANYAYYAIKSYEDITDTFEIENEYEEELFNTKVHVVEFNYSLSLESGVKSFSCLSAFVMREGRAYVLTCTSDIKEYKLYKDDFYRIYRTMCLTDI